MPGRIITFYSYKGGTGRSMALANFGWILAAAGKRVLMIDWDLEAPGLHRYLRPFLVDPDLFETDGLIDMFWNLTATVLAREPGGTASSPPLSNAEIGELLEDAKRRIDWKFPPGGYIDFVAAGRQGETYSQRVNSFDWKKFYQHGGAQLLDAAKAYLQSRFDWILIDSRTGVSDTSGICTMQLPDTVVACFTMNRQSIEGVSSILRSIRSYQSSTVDGSKIAFFPLATRIENGEKDRLEAARGFARSALEPFVPLDPGMHLRDYWDQMEISYRPSYAFEEILAAFGDATGAAGAADTMLAQMEKMAWRITGNRELQMPEILGSDRAEVLQKYALGTPIPPTVTAQTPPADARVLDFLRGVLAKEQIWRTRNYNWRLLLSRRELDLLTAEDLKTFGRTMNYYHRQSVQMQRVLSMIDILSPLTWVFSVGGYLLWRTLYGTGLPEFVPVLAAFGAFCFWILLALAGTVILSLNGPHGVTAKAFFRICLLGPFRGQIEDYEVVKGE